MSTILKGPVSPLGVHLEALGAHLEHTWRPLGLQDAPGVQQKGSKGVQRAKIEPERESEHDFGAHVVDFILDIRPTHCIDMAPWLVRGEGEGGRLLGEPVPEQYI